MQLSPFTPQPQKTRQMPRFGNGYVRELTGVTHVFNEGFKRITHDRTTEMLLEDFVGFGVLRTYMDWRRGKTYGNDQNNLPAASERMARETLSILTDNVLAGGVAYGIGSWLDRDKQGFSNQFIDFDTLELFQDVAKTVQAQALANAEAAKEEFLKELQKRFEGAKTLGPDARKACQEFINDAWEAGKNEIPKQSMGQGFQNWWNAKKDNPALTNATRLVKALDPNQGTYSWNLVTKDGKSIPVKLDNLSDDITRFARHMKEATQGSTKGWAETATETIKHTLKTKSQRIPLAITAAMAATFAVPFVISELTRKWWGIDYYPGEIGLRKQPSPGQQKTEPKKSFWERHFPYMAQTLKDGNPAPFLVSLTPLFFAAGFFNTVNRSFLSPGKGFIKNWLKNFDFQKAKPFTAQQQMASVFALLITSRLWNSRSDNEFRERMVDSFLGWGLWILGTPLIKKAIASLSDRPADGTVLLNEQGELRSQAEIKNLLQVGMHVNGKELTQEMLDKTYHRNVWLGIGSTIATMIMLGVVEPWIGIRWTQHNEKKKQAAEATQAKPIVPLNPSMPVGAVRQSFGGYRPSQYGAQTAWPSYGYNQAYPAYKPTYDAGYYRPAQWPPLPPVSPRYRA